MKKTVRLILHNLKKDKGSFVSFGVIVLFTAFMLCTALVLAFQTGRAYDEKFDTLNAASINVLIPEAQDTSALADKLGDIDGVENIESRRAVFVPAVVRDFRGTDFEMNTVFYDIGDERTVNLLDIHEQADGISEPAVWLPAYVADFGEFAAGDAIVYEINGDEFAFTVAGTAEEMQYGNYGIGLIGAYLSDSAYDEFLEENGSSAVTEYSIVIDRVAALTVVKNDTGDVLSDNGVTMLAMSDRDSVKGTRTMVSSLLILILIAFACVILLVSVFLSRFRISNSIEDEMVSMGVLKAIGYTGSMMIASVVTPYMLITLLGALAGIALSYAALPSLAGILTMQSGFSFTPVFDSAAAGCAVFIPMLVVFIFTVSAARRIKKLQPIAAIRGSSDAGSSAGNPLPLENTKLSTGLRLVLKQMCAEKKQNVLLFLVFFVLTVLTAFSGTLFYNVVVKPENFMSTLSEETPDAVFVTSAADAEQLADILRVDSDVRDVLQYNTESVNIGSSAVTAFVCEDYSRVQNDLCYLGRDPQDENEIALGRAFEDGYSIGDTVTVESGDNSHEYTVTGFIQSVNYQGSVCELTSGGCEALCGKISASSLYVYLNDGIFAEDVIDRYEDEHSALISKAVDSQKLTATSQDMYMSISAAVIAAIFVLTVLIVLFILYIVIRSLLVRRKQELGIYKALGYTSGQLMRQTAGSFMPVTAAAVLLSSAFGMVYMPYINSVIFSSVGAVKNNMELSFGFLMLFAAALIIVDFIIGILLALPIKKITAYSLIKE